jgi:hypothetical protein
VKRGETREAHRVEPASAGRSSDAAEHVVAAHDVSDPVPTDQLGRQAVRRIWSLPVEGQPILGADLKRSEERRASTPY